MEEGRDGLAGLRDLVVVVVVFMLLSSLININVMPHNNIIDIEPGSKDQGRS